LRRTTRSGFTLVEILVSLGLAGLIVAGAFQLNNSFTQQSRRQNQIADVQQSLRLTMNILEHSIRAAGAGLSGNLLRFTGCGVAPPDLYAFQYYNSNVFPPVFGSYDTNTSDNDTDPDWFRVLIPESGQYLITADTGSASTILGGPLTTWAARDLFVVLQPGSQTLSCVREVTSAAGTTVVHNTPGAAFPCANPATEAVASGVTDVTHCGLNGIAANPSPVRHFTNEVVYKIWTPPAGSLDSPKLVMMRPAINQLTDGPWTVVAENIEDMQIALIMKNGSICNSVDSPALCNPTAISAVRITLVGRSTSKVQGLANGKTGGYEDSAEVATTDGYLRRSLTSVVQMRN